MSAIRFCPFCREPFEGERCPDHGLPLVTGVELASVARIPHESELLAPTDFRFGRLTVILGALVVVVGFGLPFVVDRTRGDQTTSAFELWQLRADYLALVPTALVGIVTLAFVRRTRRDLRRIRLAMGVALGFAILALAVAASRIVDYGRHLDRIGAENGLEIAGGAFVLVAGFVVLAIGIVRLGSVGSR